jgi:sugar lactone lactonase YvrE
VVLNPLNGDLYVADWVVNSIRRLSGGVVTTLATGFSSPCGACLSANGTVLHVADYGSHRLLAVAIDTGDVGAAAGTGAAGFEDGPAVAVARLNGPVDCAFWAGGGGVAYISDSLNHAIRSLAGGFVATLAGTDAAGWRDGAAAYAALNRPWGLALSLDNATLFFAEFAGHRVRAVALGAPGPVVRTLAGNGTAASSNGVGSAAAFNAPVSLLVGPRSGLVYLAEWFGNRVRRVDPLTGNVSTLAGSGVAGFTQGPAAAAKFNRPIGLAATADESAWYLMQQTQPALRSVVCSPPTFSPAVSASASGSSSSATASGTATGSVSESISPTVTSSGTLTQLGTLSSSSSPTGSPTTSTTPSPSSAAGQCSVTTLAGSDAAPPGCSAGVGASATFTRPCPCWPPPRAPTSSWRTAAAGTCST